MSIGIVGLPNAGKSTIFNALTKARNAQCASYPFCTIEPNKAVVPVYDSRVDRVAELVEPKKKAYATIEFIDIAGLVKGANKGEGLGNQFLAQIRECQAVLHVVRCFEDPNVAHVCGDVDPVRDADITNTELVLKDIETLENAIGKMQKKVRNEKDLETKLDMAREMKQHLETGSPATLFPKRESKAARAIRAEYNLLSDKKTIYCANIDEDSLHVDDFHVEALRNFSESRGENLEVLCGSIENEIANLGEPERTDFLDLYGLEKSGLEETVKNIYSALGLQSYITAKRTEVRAWTVPVGCKAPEAAGLIHNDFQRGFISANVVAFEDFDRYGSMQAARDAGVLRVEGKDYEIQDGDVVEFLFNV